MTTSQGDKQKKVRTKKEQFYRDYVDLHNAWLASYTAWSKLSPEQMRIFSMPKEPMLIDGKLYI